MCPTLNENAIYLLLKQSHQVLIGSKLSLFCSHLGIWERDWPSQWLGSPLCNWIVRQCQFILLIKITPSNICTNQTIQTIIYLTKQQLAYCSPVSNSVPDKNRRTDDISSLPIRTVLLVFLKLHRKMTDKRFKYIS